MAKPIIKDENESINEIEHNLKNLELSDNPKESMHEIEYNLESSKFSDKVILDSKSAFKSLDLPDSLIKVLDKINFHYMTPVQKASIPFVLAGRDILGSAQTGTGKTGAFSVPMISKLINDSSLSSLILAPTRELAMQVSDFIRKLCIDDVKIGTALLIGGDSIHQQIDRLKRKPRIIIGTPGRVIDHLERKTLRLDQFKILILDETDRMLDLGFGLQLDRILQDMPKDKQTLMFSATIASQIEVLAKKYLNNPERITTGSNNTPIENINQKIINVNESEKYGNFLSEIRDRKGSIVVFAGTKQNVERLTDKLDKENYSVDYIHGDLHQNKRTRIIANFKKQKFLILVATDIAARGLDIEHIRHVINYDLPQCPEDYIHRIGRTARAGAKGDAVSFITPSDSRKWYEIMKIINPAEAANLKPSGSARGRSSQNRGRSANNKNDSFFGFKKSNDRKPRDGRFGKKPYNSDEGSSSGDQGSSFRGPRSDNQRPSFRGQRNDDQRPSFRGSRNDDQGSSFRGPRNDDQRSSFRGPRNDDQRSSFRGPRNDDQRPSFRGQRDDDQRRTRKDDQRSSFKGSRNDNQKSSFFGESDNRERKPSNRNDKSFFGDAKKLTLSGFKRRNNG